jgi:Flp pilus assembly protein TadD
MMNCPYCGRLTDPKLEACLHCGGPLRAKAPQSSAAQPAMIDGNRCPACQSPVQSGDIICVRCGTNLLTGHRIAAEQPPILVTPEPRATWKWALAVVVAVLIAAGGAVLWFTIFHDPVKDALRLCRQNKTTEAENLLEKYLEKHPKRYAAQLLFGKLEAQGKQFPRAYEAFRSAADLPDATRDAALLAVSAAANLPGDDGRNKQIQALRTLATRYPDDPDARRLLALSLGVANDAAGLMEETQHVLDKSPNDPAALRWKAVAAILQGDLPGAALTVDAAMLASPNQADTLAVKGVAAALEQQSADAANWLGKALEQNTSAQDEVRVRLAVTEMGQGHFEKALELLRSAKANAAPGSDAAFDYALCLIANKLDTEAQAELEKIVNAGGAHAGEAAVETALSIARQGNVARASDAIRKAEQLGCKTARMYAVQGYLHAAEGNLVEAQRSLQTSAQTDPNYPAAQLESGLLAIRQGQMSEGIGRLKKYLDLVKARGDQLVPPEIELLIAQLQQTTGAPGSKPAAAPVARTKKETVK